MDANLFLICLLTFVIHLVGTLAYAARIAGVRTRRIAVSFALFNILVLVSRTSNSFQLPFLGKRVERMLWSEGGIGQMRESVSMPAPANLSRLRDSNTLSNTMIALNVVSVALWTVGIFASFYAGYLNPQLRLTSSSLSSFVNGTATILMFVVIDPQVSVMTDDVVEGRLGEPGFRRAIVWLVGSRFAGTLLSQLLLAPAASLIVFVAEKL